MTTDVYLRSDNEYFCSFLNQFSRHIDETERSIQKRGSEVPETITQLQEDYYLNREVIVSHWDSCISALKWEHRQALRTFVMSYEGHINSLPTNNDRPNLTRMFLKDRSVYVFV